MLKGIKRSFLKYYLLYKFDFKKDFNFKKFNFRIKIETNHTEII